jgi:AraC-like DNA-binding protein
MMPRGAPTLRVLPDAAVDLVFAGDHVAVAGPCIEELPPGRIIGVQLHPAAVPAVLGVPASALRDQRVPLAELWGHTGRDLAEELAGMTAPRSATDLIEQVCVDRFAADALMPIAARLRDLLERGERLDARRLGTSERHLRRTCDAAFGYGPRMLRRIVRFQHVVRLLARADPPSLVDAAQATGHVDQAHLSREVGAFSGLTPAGLRRALGGRTP